MSSLLFVDVIIPLKLEQSYTYSLPIHLQNEVKVGSRVVVQFGAKKVYTGIVKNIHEIQPEHKTKEVLDALDKNPIITPTQLKLYHWIADYYVCSIGEVLSVALPSGFKLGSESKVQLNPHFERDTFALNSKEQQILDVLEEKDNLSYTEIGELLGIKVPYPYIKGLVEKEAILLFEEVKDKFIAKTEKHLFLGSKVTKVTDLLDEYKSKQLIAIQMFLRLTHFKLGEEYQNTGISRKELVKKGASDSSLKTLIKKGIFVQKDITLSRFSANQDTFEPQKISLSEVQSNARDSIIKQFEEKPAVLLHGVTGSGKTEIYIDLIQKTLAKGKQVLFLLPEIALTTQIVQRLQKVFGNEMGVYHSKFSSNERVETWKGVIDGRFQFVVGVRSSIFLPFDNLGLIIIDEEHESSYKQHDPAPYYQAKNTALVLGHFLKAPVLLGSATPSVESYYHALEGKWGLVSITQRFGKAQLPKIIPVDIQKEKITPNNYDFSKSLIEALETCLEREEQAILFQNRRGYAPFLMCEDCGHIPKCQDCDVSLTYHLHSQELCCHYCGHIEKNTVQTCGSCGSSKVKMMGQGTEKVEDELNLMFPKARMQRMDLDTTRKKNAYQNIIDKFAKKEVDFLIGTQMISKGLDFDSVNTVAVFDFDRMVNFPDFRAQERTFQMMTQVSGRAGRRGTQGKVLIQTKDVRQEILEKIQDGNYRAFYDDEILERALFRYPPFTRLIRIMIKHESQASARNSAQWFAKLLLIKLTKEQVLGPQEPIVNKIRNKYLQEIMLKIDKDDAQLKDIKNIIQKTANYLNQQQTHKKTQFTIDVDPN